MTAAERDPMCAERCAYGACGDPGKYRGPYGCGGCCDCLGGCQAAYEATLPIVTADEPDADACVFSAATQGCVKHPAPTPLGDIADT